MRKGRYKLRNSGMASSGYPVKALTVPSEIAVFHENTIFSVEKSGTSIIYTSGSDQTITKKQLEVYNYEDCRLK